MKKLNIIWMLGESIRNYPGNDRYSKYEIIDKIAKEGVMFNNMVITAPSSLMSPSSMMTSQSPVHLSRTYADLKFDTSQFLSLSGILKENGYNIYATLHHSEGRKPMAEFLHLLDQKDLPEGIKNDLWWKSEEVDKVLDHILNKGMKEPFFLLINYNNQENTRGFIELAIEKFKKKGLYEDSIFIFCPDHPFPDEDRNGTIGRHEINLTDANLLINFFIKYPDCPKKEINQLVSPLDIVPTILEIIEIPSQKYTLNGNSFLPFINGQEEYTRTKFRTDIKYIFQKERVVCIRDKRFKYLFYFDNGIEKFFDLEKDPNEKNNLIDSQEYDIQIKELKGEFNKTEEELENFHLNYLISEFRKQMRLFVRKNPKKILLLGSAHRIVIEAVLKGLNVFSPGYEVDLMINPGLIEEKKYVGVNFRYVDIKEKNHNYYFPNDPLFKANSKKIPVQYKTISYDEFKKKHSSLCTKDYDLVIVPLDNPYGAGHKELSKIVKEIKTKKIIYINNNMEFKKPTNWFLEGLRLINAKKNYYIRNPTRLFFEVKRYLKEIN